MLTSKRSIAAIAMLIAFSSFSLANAVTPVDIREDVKEKVEDRVKQGCDNIETRIEAKVTKFNSNKRAHVTAYNNMLDRVKKFIEKLSEKGYDTTKLKGDLQVLNTKILKFGNDYTTYSKKLVEAQNFACGASEGEFKAKLEEAKAALKVVRQDVIDIKDYYQKTVRADLANLKNQTPSTK